MGQHNEYLTTIEKYLMDLSVMERNKLLQVASEKIADMPTHELGDPLNFANKLRAEHDFTPYFEKQKFSFLRFLFKFFGFMTAIFLIFTLFLVWKFSPILKIDEESNRVIILGGLIDIDGQAGRIKLVDQVQFVNNSYNDDLEITIPMNQDKDEILVEFNSGLFNIESSLSNDFQLTCKVSKAPETNIISNDHSTIIVDMKNFKGSNCKLLIPPTKKISMDGKEASINIIKPEFHSYIDINNGNIAFEPQNEQDYKFQLKIENGFTGNFESSDSPEAYEVNIEIENGSMTSK